ncbi:hypothetical protein BDV18DRAFT_153097 [Aspergillus unguis]
MQQPPAKRPRLSMACNICRQRKVKCDAEYPKCRNCLVRNQECVTTDPQRGCAGVREWLDLSESAKVQTGSGQGVRPGDGRNALLSPRQHSTTTQAEHIGVRVDVLPEDQESPVRQPFDTSVNIEDGTHRRKILGGSSSQCLAKSLDVYFRAMKMQPVSGFFRHGMRQAEELDIPLGLTLPKLPCAEQRKKLLSAYSVRIHRLYPIIDLERLGVGMDYLERVSDLHTLPRDDIPNLVAAYLVLSIGLDETGQCPTEEGKRYLLAAASLVSHLIVVPYLRTVQAMILFAITYRGRNKEGLAWQMLGIGIRTAYTLGIHRRSKDSMTDELHLRIWAACCSLEKVMHLASGWPTLIPDDLMASPTSVNSTKHPFLHWHIGLARYQGSISHHLYSFRSSTRNISTAETVRQILLNTARLDRALLSWASEMPTGFQPGSDIHCAAEDFHVTALLSIEYHGTMIALHRAALIAPKHKIEEEVTKHIPNDPSRFRLASGESICVNSARAIAKLSLELQDRELDSVLIPTGTAGLACIALAIYLMKHPRSSMRAADSQLLKACLEYARTRFAQCGFDRRYLDGLDVIYEQIRTRLAADGSEGLGDSNSSLRESGKHHTVSRTSDKLPTPSTLGQDKSFPTHNTDYARSSGPGADMSQGRTHSGSDTIPNSQDTSHIYRMVREQPNAVQDNSVDTGTGTDPFSDPTGGASRDPFMGLDQYPFEGFNVEDLWNWMLYFDSLGSFNYRAKFSRLLM